MERGRWREGRTKRGKEREEGGSEGKEECSLSASINGFRGVSHFH
jgi:hypothetical protein